MAVCQKGTTCPSMLATTQDNKNTKVQMQQWDVKLSSLTHSLVKTCIDENNSS